MCPFFKELSDFEAGTQDWDFEVDSEIDVERAWVAEYEVGGDIFDFLLDVPEGGAMVVEPGGE